MGFYENKKIVKYPTYAACLVIEGSFQLHVLTTTLL